MSHFKTVLFATFLFWIQTSSAELPTDSEAKQLINRIQALTDNYATSGMKGDEALQKAIATVNEDRRKNARSEVAANGDVVRIVGRPDLFLFNAMLPKDAIPIKPTKLNPNPGEEDHGTAAK